MAKRVRSTSAYAKKQKVNHSQAYNYSEDRISELPDAILVSILSLLTSREAARTCILSHRWENLWTFTTCGLSFDGPRMMLRKMKYDELQSMPKSKLLIQRAKYTSLVNQFLKVHQGPTIDEFRVRLGLDRSSTSDIDTWVYFAIKKRVQRLNLDLSSGVGTALNKRYYFPNLNLLRSRAIGFSSFNSLTALCLKRVNVNGELLEYFLSSFLFLEQLSVVDSYSLVNLKVAGPSLKLKYLEISHCFRVKNIEICAADLVSFKYYGRWISVPFKNENVPNLVEVSVGGNYCEYLINHIPDHSSYLSQLEVLTLDIFPLQNTRFLDEFPELINLKQLVLIVSAREDQSLLRFTPLLKATPFLHRFVLRFTQSQSYEPCIEREVRKTKKYPHQCLKLVELVGFVGRTNDVEFVMHLLEIAISLEKIIIDPRPPYMVESPWKFEETVEVRGARKRAKQLKKKLPAGVELVIH